MKTKDFITFFCLTFSTKFPNNDYHVVHYAKMFYPQVS